MKPKERNSVPIKWVFKSWEDIDRLISLKSRNVVKGYMKVSGVDAKESFLPVSPDTLTMILIGLNLYHEEDGWIAELCDVKAALVHPNMEVGMYIEYPKDIVDLGIITKEFMEEYFILLGK